MSACKTGCGVASTDAYLCDDHFAAWMSSRELRRSDAIESEAGGAAMKGKRHDVAFMDFCNRVRAESRPEVPHDD